MVSGIAERQNALVAELTCNLDIPFRILGNSKVRRNGRERRRRENKARRHGRLHLRERGTRTKALLKRAVCGTGEQGSIAWRCRPSNEGVVDVRRVCVWGVVGNRRRNLSGIQIGEKPDAAPNRGLAIPARRPCERNAWLIDQRFDPGRELGTRNYTQVIRHGRWIRDRSERLIETRKARFKTSGIAGAIEADTESHRKGLRYAPLVLHIGAEIVKAEMSGREVAVSLLEITVARAQYPVSKLLTGEENIRPSLSQLCRGKICEPVSSEVDTEFQRVAAHDEREVVNDLGLSVSAALRHIRGKKTKSGEGIPASVCAAGSDKLSVGGKC